MFIKIRSAKYTRLNKRDIFSIRQITNLYTKFYKNQHLSLCLRSSTPLSFFKTYICLLPDPNFGNVYAISGILTKYKQIPGAGLRFMVQLIYLELEQGFNKGQVRNKAEHTLQTNNPKLSTQTLTLAPNLPLPNGYTILNRFLGSGRSRELSA